MHKSRLFLFGDSFVDWDIPSYHWSDYLKEHYDVNILGERGSDNISIIFQLGKLPEYREGDRIIIYWSDPSRIQKHLMGKMKPKQKSRWWHYSDVIDKSRIETLEKMKVDRSDGWNASGLENELLFIKKLKYILSEYNPIYVTWNNSFYNKTKQFTDLVQVSTLHDESGEGETKGDWHPGEQGCYDIYKILLAKLGNETPLPFKNNLL